jgi:anti-sigma B factor antagonist
VSVESAELRLETARDVVVAHLEGELDLSNVRGVGEAIRRALSNDVRALVVDLTGVTYLDSAAIHVLYRLHTRLQERAQRLWIAVAADTPVAATLGLAGVLTAIPTAPSVEAALRALGDAVDEP